MKLFHAPASPFVRKCVVAAIELGLRERIEFLPAAAHPVNRDKTVVARNPLGKVPTLVTDDGTALFDSRVICEYFDALAGGGKLIPREGAARWRVLVDQSLADGINDAAVLMRYEAVARPEALRWQDWTTGQMEKVASGLATFEAGAADFGERVDLGTIAFACALGYLDFRFASLDWRARHPRTAAWYEGFGARASMVATRPA